MPDIYEMAEQHVQPASSDRDLLRLYVDAAIDMVERQTGLVLADERSGERIIIPLTDIERTRDGMFRTSTGTKLGGVVKINIPVPVLQADVYFMTSRQQRRYAGKFSIVNGRMCLPACVDGACCLDECSYVEVHVPGVKDSDWPPSVKQAILQVAKWLYEHRGDTVNRPPGSILKDSGALQLLIGYVA